MDDAKQRELDAKDSVNWIITPGLKPVMDSFVKLVENNYCEKAARKKPLMIMGDTGVGKTMFCEAFKNIYSSRFNVNSDKIFTVSIAGLEPNLITSELFGHVRGAYTGANKDRKGFLEQADGGLLFIEEIGELSENDQAKLLTFIEDGYYYRVGSTERQKADVQIIATTNRSKDDKVFRRDFLLRFFPFYVPPIYKRRLDALYYFQEMFEDYFKALNRTEILNFVSYHWPGNVREIQNVGFLMHWYDKFRTSITSRKTRSGKDYVDSCLCRAKEYSPFTISSFPYFPLSSEFMEGLLKYGVNYSDQEYVLKRLGFFGEQGGEDYVLDLPLKKTKEPVHVYMEKSGLQMLLPTKQIEDLHVRLWSLMQLWGFNYNVAIPKNLMDIKEGDVKGLILEGSIPEAQCPFIDDRMEEIYRRIIKYRLGDSSDQKVESSKEINSDGLAEQFDRLRKKISKGVVRDKELKEFTSSIMLKAYRRILGETGWNYAKAARRLDMPPTTLKTRVKKHKQPKSDVIMDDIGQ